MSFKEHKISMIFNEKTAIRFFDKKVSSRRKNHIKYSISFWEKKRKLFKYKLKHNKGEKVLMKASLTTMISFFYIFISRDFIVQLLWKVLAT